MTSNVSFTGFPDEPEGFRRLREHAEQIMREHNDRMAHIKAMFEDGVLADVQRTTAALEPVRAQIQAAMD